MANLPTAGLTSPVPFQLYRRLAFGGAGANVQTITADKVILPTHEDVLIITPSGADRSLTLPSPTVMNKIGQGGHGLFHWIGVPAAASQNIVVKTSGAATLATVAPGSATLVVFAGTEWKVAMAPAAQASSATNFGISGLLSLAASSTAAAPAVAFTGDATSGVYRVSAGVLAFALGGVAGPAIGSASAPTHAAATDTAGADVYLVAPAAGGTATTAKAGAALILNSGAGSVGSAAVAGGPGGVSTSAGGVGGAKGGVGTAAGGAGGARNSTGGAGGATASAGTDAGGAGGTSNVTGGAGGNATAGTGNGGAGGPVALTPGAGGTTTGGTAGLLGDIQLKGPLSSPVTAAQDVAGAGGTITLPTTGVIKILTATGSPGTGTILTAGKYAGQMICLIQATAANSITMAAAGTSNVADGTGCVLVALKAYWFAWDGTSRWYRTAA